MTVLNHQPVENMFVKTAAPGQLPGALTASFSFAPEYPVLTDPGKKAGGILAFKNDQGHVTLQISLGDSKKFSAETMRQCGGALANWLFEHNASQLDIHAPNLPEAAASTEAISALAEGLLLGAFRFNRYKKPDSPLTSCTVYFFDPTSSLAGALDDAVTLASCVNLARDWAHEPANVINPITLAERAQNLAEYLNLKCTVLDDTALAAMGAGAIVNVGKGSQSKPRLIIIEYPGQPEAAGCKPVVLVGKALTFDSGGYTLKDSTNIQGMKYDKCGGMTVLATIMAAAQLKLKQPVVGIIGAAENLVSGEAYRPDDIITTLKGKTIEIISTDAEGRLVLADALAYSQQQYQPAALIDLATLTGGVVTALGRVRAGLMSNNDDLAAQLFATGEKTGEKLWRLPLDDEYLKNTSGDDADLKNSGGREAHPIMGGIFLKQFVEDQVPWAHLDIAGVATTPKELPYCVKGATGFGVRLLIEYLRSL